MARQIILKGCVLTSLLVPRSVTREHILTLEPFQGLKLSEIIVPETPQALANARATLLDSVYLGFDTEVRPFFKKGEPLRGPDVVQFSTLSQAYVLQLRVVEHRELAKVVLASGSVVKVGFDLHHDQQQLMRALGVHARPLLDLDVIFNARGYPRTLGVRAAVALLFNRRFTKSKRVTTSNWSVKVLDPKQILYAGNDAFAARAVLEKLALNHADLPIWAEGRPPLRIR